MASSSSTNASFSSDHPLAIPPFSAKKSIGAADQKPAASKPTTDSETSIIDNTSSSRINDDQEKIIVDVDKTVSKDDIMVGKRSQSDLDLRLLYRSWRTGAAEGADMTVIDKKMHAAGSVSSSHSSNENLVSITHSPVEDSFLVKSSPPLKPVTTSPQLLGSQQPHFSSPLDFSPLQTVNESSTVSSLSISKSTSVLNSMSASSSSSDLSALTCIPEKSDFDFDTGPLMMDHCDDIIMESNTARLSKLFQAESEFMLPKLENIPLSSSFDTPSGLTSFMRNQQRKRNDSVPSSTENAAVTPPTSNTPSSSLQNRSFSYTGLSDLEKSNYFPCMPKQSASGVQRGLKDSVMNDMCRAVVKQMVGDLYVHSSYRRGKKIVNHLYEPLLESVQSHFRRLPSRYALSVNPDDVPMHMRLLAKQERIPSGIALHAQWCKNDDGSVKTDVCEVVVVTNDQDCLLDAITRSLTGLKGKILDADVMTTTTDVALDRFVVRGNFVSEEKLLELKTLIETKLEQSNSDDKPEAGVVLSPTMTSPPALAPAGSRLNVVESPRKSVKDMIGSHDDSVNKEWKIDLAQVTLEVPVGSGRSGQTYRAYWRGVKVAAKILNLTNVRSNDDGSAPSEELLDEFYRESALVCRLRHPNVVLFLGAAIEPPTYCLLFEFMEKGTLTDLIRQRKIVLDFFRTSREIALGMNYLHHCSIIHRDLKSGNILLDSHGTAKVSDFGLSCVFDLSSGGVGDLTAETGTYRWMAPEVIKHEPYSNKADVYSYGIVLWELIMKDQPFRGMTPIQAAFAVARQQMRPALPAYLPTKLGELVEHCWHQDPRHRPTFEEIIEVLPLVKKSLRKRDFSQLGFVKD